MPPSAADRHDLDGAPGVSARTTGAPRVGDLLVIVANSRMSQNALSPPLWTCPTTPARGHAPCPAAITGSGSAREASLRFDRHLGAMHYEDMPTNSGTFRGAVGAFACVDRYGRRIPLIGVSGAACLFSAPR